MTLHKDVATIIKVRIPPGVGVYDWAKQARHAPDSTRLNTVKELLASVQLARTCGRDTIPFIEVENPLPHEPGFTVPDMTGDEYLELFDQALRELTE